MEGNCEENLHFNSLTEDLLIEILLWLPVVSLLRFKAVCKYWRSIIESSDFIHRHANFDNSTASNRGSGDSQEDSGQWNYKNLGTSPHLSDEDEYEMYASYPPQANMVGSCHGIICIHDPHLGDVILWNPATKKYRCLPKSLPLLDEFGVLKSEFVLFGFDCETYDYKVLQITFFEIDNEIDVTPPNRTQIYSLRSDSWKWCMDASLSGHSYKANTQNQGRYHNGSYYFVGNNFIRKQWITNSVPYWYVDAEPVVLCFNFSRESFRMIPGPCDKFDLDVIGGDRGKIACITFDYNGSHDVYEVYTLDDYSCSATNSNEYSWSKSHAFTVNCPNGGIGTKAITKNGVFGFLSGIGGGLVFVNFLTAEMKDIEIIDGSLEGLGYIIRADVYKESLLSIHSAVPSSSSSSSS
ncbi:F-box/kelch-repeat protein At3g23880-like [Papaver somniferum]|uniref:F-box/kelch-repeat protein At3g23880-like n=1 Tax=Papaver somniferum TaxID=3469 RepID=UPI000E6FBA3F|nr:F-box/kelch-repeat protein At3g23880-like [Papaver somniferum]